MTAEEAINILKLYTDEDRRQYYQPDFVKAHEMAISALEKQIAKKPKIHRETPWNTKIYRCPCCEVFVEVYLEEKYCALCGQAICWEE